MTRRRSPLALLAAAALTAALVPALGPGAGPVAAAPPDGSAARPFVAPAAPPQGRAWLEGLVVDQAGRPLDNVVVQAFDAFDDDPDAAPVATWITYADPADGPAHGFYRLYVPQGSDAVYDIRFSSAEGTRDPYRTRSLDGAHLVGGGKRRGGVVHELGTTVMTLERKADATVSLTPSRDVTRHDRAGRLSVSVSSPDVDPVTGKLLLTVDGRTKGQQVLTPRSDGRAVFALPELKAGRHTLAVRYAGSALVRATEGRSVVKVDEPPKKGKGGGHR